MGKKGLKTLFLMGALLMAGCAAGISPGARSQITYGGPFQAVQAYPDGYVGKVVMWGGKIIETRILNGGTEITVLQTDLTSTGTIKEEAVSQGRFIVRSPSFLDPAIYAAGTWITVVGNVAGSESRLIGEMPYRYPVVGVMEMKQWAPKDDVAAPPRFQFGFGVGTHL